MITARFFSLERKAQRIRMSAQTHHSRREANFGGSNYGMGRTEQRYLLDHRAFQALATKFELTMKDLNLARQRQGCGVPGSLVDPDASQIRMALSKGLRASEPAPDCRKRLARLVKLSATSR